MTWSGGSGGRRWGLLITPQGTGRPHSQELSCPSVHSAEAEKLSSRPFLHSGLLFRASAQRPPVLTGPPDHPTETGNLPPPPDSITWLRSLHGRPYHCLKSSCLFIFTWHMSFLCEDTPADFTATEDGNFYCLATSLAVLTPAAPQGVIN